MTNFTFTWYDAIDILLVTLLIYYVILFVRGTRAVAAINGLFFLLVLYVIAQIFDLHAVVFIFENVFSSIFLVIVILFHEDIRQALSNLNFRSIFGSKQKYQDDAIAILSNSCFSMSEKGVGALIILESQMPLGDVANQGVDIDAQLSSDLLETIFFPKTPLHDGAVIIDKRGRVKAGGCILPLAGGERQHFGTRHRAALGITEVSDALAIVVSEERGEVTIAQNGNLSNPLTKQRFERMLRNATQK